MAELYIPLFIYAPGFITPREVSALAEGRIDLAPTLLGLLHMDYVSTFYGRDVLRDEPGRSALIGNYPLLGLFDGKDLAILSPRKKIRLRENAAADEEHERPATPEDPLVRRAIAYYEGAATPSVTGCSPGGRKAITALIIRISPFPTPASPCASPGYFSFPVVFAAPPLPGRALPDSVKPKKSLARLQKLTHNRRCLALFW